MNEKMTLYHGSHHEIQIPVYGKGNPKNDYGLGFYCTEDPELAKEWASAEEAQGYVNQYELDTSTLSVMHLSGPKFNSLNWITLLINNRTFRTSNDIAVQGKAFLTERFLPDTSTSDVIIGYRADDSYFAFANAFLNNTISLAQLEKALYLGNLGEQVMLKTPNAFRQLSSPIP